MRGWRRQAHKNTESNVDLLSVITQISADLAHFREYTQALSSDNTRRLNEHDTDLRKIMEAVLTQRDKHKRLREENRSLSDRLAKLEARVK